LTDKKTSEYDYKMLDFDFMGTDQLAWGKQLINDLENLFMNEGLQIIGAFSKINRLTEFSLVMYQMSEEARERKFDIKLQTLTGPIDPEAFEQYITKQYEKQRLIYRCIFTIYSLERRLPLENESSRAHLEVNVQTNFIIFQKVYGCEKFKFNVKKIPNFNKRKIDPEVFMLDFITSQKEMECIGIITNTKINDSMMVFAELLPYEDEDSN
jgi:hypothetical protein